MNLEDTRPVEGLPGDERAADDPSGDERGRRRPPRAALAALWLCLWLSPLASASGQDFEADRARLLPAVLRSARPGAVFDRWVRLHLDHGHFDTMAEAILADAGDAPGAQHHRVLALIALERGEVDTARERLLAAEDADPRDPHAPRILAELEAARGQVEASEAARDRALALASEDQRAELWKQRATFLLRQGRTEAALASLGALVESAGSDRYLLADAAELLSDAGDFEAARRCWQRAVDLAPDDLALAWRATDAVLQDHVRQDQIEQARQLGTQWLDRLDPGSWQRQRLLATLERAHAAAGSQDGDAAWLDYLRRTCETRPQDLALRADLARALLDRGQEDEALKAWDALLRDVPTRLDLRAEAVQAALQAGRLDRASEAAQQLARLCDEQPALRLQAAGWILAAADADLDGAAEQARRWIAAVADHPPAETGRLMRAAAASHEFARRLPPGSERWRDRLNDDAEALYARAIAGASDPVPALEALAELQRERGRRDDSLSTSWRSVEGALASADSLLRLSRRFDAWQEHQQTRRALDAALSLDADHEATLFDSVEFELEHGSLERARGSLDHLDQVLARRSADEADPWRTRGSSFDLRLRLWARDGGHRVHGRRLEKQLAEQDEDVFSLWLLATSALGSADLQGAIGPMRRARELAPASPTLAEEWARCLHTVGRRKEAAQAWIEAAARFDAAALDYLEEAVRAALDAEEFALAAEAADRRLRRSPDVGGLMLRAEVAVATADWGEALSLHQRALRMDPDRLETRLALASTLEALGRPAEALEQTWSVFQRADRPRLDLVDGLLNLARLAGTEARLDDRLRRAAQREYPPDTMHLALISALRARGEDAQAREIGEQLLRARPDHVLARSITADLAEAAGELEAALTHLQHLHSIAPEEVEALRLADLLVRTGRLDQARRFWEQHLEGRGEAEDLLAQIDQSAYAGRHQHAFSLARVGAQMRPEDWRFRHRLALLQYAHGEWGLARRSCLQTMALLPPSPPAAAPNGPVVVDIPRLRPAAAAAHFQVQGGSGMEPIELDPGLSVLRVRVDSQAVVLRLDDVSYYVPTPRRWPEFPSLRNPLSRRVVRNLRELPERVERLQQGAPGGLSMPSNEAPEVVRLIASHQWFVCAQLQGDLPTAVAALDPADCAGLLSGALASGHPDLALVLAERAETQDPGDLRVHATRLLALSSPPPPAVLRQQRTAILRSVEWFAVRHPATRSDLLQTSHTLFSDAGLPEVAEAWVQGLLDETEWSELDEHVSLLVRYQGGRHLPQVAERVLEAAAAASDDESRLRIHLHALNEHLPLDLDFHLNGIRLARDLDTEDARRTEVERRVVRSRDDGSVDLVEYHFPCATPELPALALHGLRELILTARDDGRLDELRQRLQDEAQRDGPHAHGWRLAQAWLAWWTARPKDCLARLEELHRARPKDEALPLALARGFLLQGQPAIAAEYVARAQLLSEVYLPRLRTLSRDIYSDLVLSDPALIADALDHLLRNSWRPEVVQAVFPPWSEVTGGWTRSPVELQLHLARFPRRARPTARHLSVHPLPEVLERSPARLVQRLEEAVLAQCAREADRSTLALAALVGLRRGSEHAVDSLRRWRQAPSAPATDPLSEPDAWWVLDAALDALPGHAETRAAWRDFVARAMQRCPAVAEAALRNRLARAGICRVALLDDLWDCQGEATEAQRLQQMLRWAEVAPGLRARAPAAEGSETAQQIERWWAHKRELAGEGRP